MNVQGKQRVPVNTGTLFVNQLVELRKLVFIVASILLFPKQVKITRNTKPPAEFAITQDVVVRGINRFSAISVAFVKFKWKT